jgi:hypothetical protein
MLLRTPVSRADLKVRGYVLMGRLKAAPTTTGK